MTDTLVQTFEAGDRVTATYYGQTYAGTVRCINGGEVVVQFDADNVPSWAYWMTGPNGERWSDSYGVYLNGAIELVKVENANPLNDSVESLRIDLENARQATLDAKSAHQWDISYIAEALKLKAEDNEMCEVFEREVRNIGDGLSSLVRESFIEEASRQRERTYRVDYTITGSVTVTAMDEDSAQEMVEEDPWSYFDRHSVDFSVDGAEVEDD